MHPILIAYVDDMDELKKLWPEYYDVDFQEDAVDYTYTGRFQKPVWLTQQEQREKDKLNEQPSGDLPPVVQ